jgi:hypothetical protein
MLITESPFNSEDEGQNGGEDPVSEALLSLSKMERKRGVCREITASQHGLEMSAGPKKARAVIIPFGMFSFYIRIIDFISNTVFAL